MDHGDVSLGGPVWLFAQLVIVATIGVALFVLVDSLRPKRAEKTSGRLREPLWLYSALMGAYLVLLVAVQIIPGLQLAAAVVAGATPFALVLGVVYLLRAVFPAEQPAEESADSRSEEPEEPPAD